MMVQQENRYWKIAPGRGGSLWVEQKENDCIAVGWNEVTDLANITDRVQLGKKLKKAGYSGKDYQLWTFFNEIEPGDKIVAVSGSKIFGLGTVTPKNYEYKEELVFHHTKAVKYDKKYWCPVSVDELSLPEDTKNRIKGIRTVIELTSKDWDLVNKQVAKLPSGFYEAPHFKGLLMAPQSEQEAIILFSAISEHLGMRIISVGTRFPDAIIQVKDNKGYWVGKTAEFELYSSRFVAHLDKYKKDPDSCDMVICWENNGGIPKGLEVIELRSKVQEML